MATIKTNAFNKNRIPENIDTIIIGSGMGGLCCGGLLSKAGQRVVILEQHYIAGGCTHVFKEQGVEFDTGLHYLGDMKQTQVLWDILTQDQGKLEWDRMGTEKDGYLYDNIVIGDKHYEFKAGSKAFLEEVKKHFGEEEMENVRKYIDYSKKLLRKDMYLKLKVIQSKWLGKLLRKLLCGPSFEMLNQTALEAVQRFTQNKDLQAMLLGQFGDYGIVPSKAPFYIHALVFLHYLEAGGVFPKGGSAAIAEKIIPTIEKNGGAVFVRRAVEKVIIRNGRAVGVKMVTGEELFAKNIISAAGVPLTYDRFLPKELVPQDLITKIKSLGMSEMAFLYAFIGMDGSPEELGLDSSNIWQYPHSDFERIDKDMSEDPDNAPFFMFIGTPCAKDSTWNERYPGKSNAVILTKANYSHYKKWEDQKSNKRDDEYKQKKQRFMDKVLEEGLYKNYPKTRGRVTVQEVGTPVTFNHYLGNLEGASYGMAFRKERFLMDDWLLPKTDIPGFYLTGQDIATMGVMGAFASGILTAHSVLGYGNVLDVFSGRDLIKDLIHLDREEKKNK